MRVALRSAGAPVALRTWADLGVLRLLAFAEAEVLASSVADDGARRLLDGDPELLRTARVWLDHGGSAQRTAAALAVHRQTLYSRLRRVAEVTGADLEDGRDRLALHLALTLAAGDAAPARQADPVCELVDRQCSGFVMHGQQQRRPAAAPSSTAPGPVTKVPGGAAPGVPPWTA